VFLDVNLRSPWWDRDVVLGGLAHARWVKLNQDELQTLYPGTQEMDAAVDALLADTRLQMVIATRGARGAVVRRRSGASVQIAPPARDTQLVDAVGAGDAFASILLLGLLREWPLERSLERAQAFASAVVGIRGATTDDPAFYRHFRDRWEGE